MIFAENIRRARKPHRCCECGAEIVPGDRYWYTSGVDDGTAWGCKQCRRCHDLVGELLAGEYIGPWEDHFVGYLEEEILNADLHVGGDDLSRRCKAVLADLRASRLALREACE